jgi:hypothetical protein
MPTNPFFVAESPHDGVLVIDLPRFHHPGKVALDLEKPVVVSGHELGGDHLLNLRAIVLRSAFGALTNSHIR